LGEETDLNRSEMRVGKLNLLKYDTITPGMEATTKIRYKDAGTLSNLYPENGEVKVSFYEQAKGIAPGQSAVFYEGDDVVGGGIILR
jgi:tRNA-specific 2-thiouridylase